MDNPLDQRSIAQLIADLSRDVTTLLRKESQLLRTEVSESVSNAGQGVIMVAGGMALALSALLILLMALVTWLSNVMRPELASLIVGVVVAVIAFFMVRSGVESLSLKGLAPDRTARQLAKDRDVVKDRI